ncbi:hypothetical protein JTE90_020405 [Oedothorax gibbosus]|uniref:Uncharacterized protein n=1 Tax=Oedothorax gibbosus TaxID=931172 RepID=A0AAV6UER6_9ARAC|nr:hypothetical protein JTE90_020405 [Oedothorax gibbosus]
MRLPTKCSKNSDDIFPLYKVSYMWFSAIGCGSTMLIGYVASLILNHKRGEVAEVPMELLSPMAKHFMKKKEDIKDKKGVTTVESIAIEKLPPPATKVDADVQTTNGASEDTEKERY